MPPSVLRGFARNLIVAPSPDKPASYTGLGSLLSPPSKGRTLFASTWNAAIYPPLAAHVSSDDIHVPKNRMSGLWNEEQPLYRMLVKKGVSTLLFAGVNTDQCVLGTLVDAYNCGWGCVLVDDCCGTTTKGGKEVSLWNVAVSNSLNIRYGSVCLYLLYIILFYSGSRVCFWIQLLSLIFSLLPAQSISLALPSSRSSYLNCCIPAYLLWMLK